MTQTGRIVPLTPSMAREAELQAWDMVKRFARNPDMLKMSGYPNLETFVQTRAKEIEKGLQAWERANP